MAVSGGNLSVDMMETLLGKSRGNNKQVICFNGTKADDNSNINTSAVNNSKVIVEVGPTNHTSGCSAVVTRNITNYSWEQQYIYGNLVAVHCTIPYIASALKAPKSQNGMVRVTDRSSGDRGLVKNIRGIVKDLAFAYIPDRALLALSDHFGTLYVYEVLPSLPNSTSLRLELIMQVNSKEDKPSDHHRVIWCPYIPDDNQDEEGDDGSYLLVVSHGSDAEIWNVSTIIENYGKGEINPEDVTTGYQFVKQHDGPITDASFSPDGTALSTASLDGYVKFFRIFMPEDGEEPRCLHKWIPHDGKPVSSLFFLDNHRHPSPEVTFWKYMVTGASNNTELRVWSCQSWICLQTLRLVDSDISNTNSLMLKASIDPSSKFILLSDINRRTIFVLVIEEDSVDERPESKTTESDEEEESSTNGVEDTNKSSRKPNTRFVSISELPVQYPALSIAINDAGWRPYKRWKHDHASDEIHVQEDGDDEADVVKGLVIRSVLINTKSLQEATISFQPAVSDNKNLIGQLEDMCISSDNIVRDGLTDISASVSDLESISLPDALTEADIIARPTSPGKIMPSQNHGQPDLPIPNFTSQLPNHLLPSNSSASLVTPNVKSSQQSTMTLLTPDSFSSPNKEDESIDNSGKQLVEDSAQREKKMTPELQNDTLSFLLRVGSGTLMGSGESMSNNDMNSILGKTNLHYLASNQAKKSPSSDQKLENILDTVISGSSRPSSRNSVKAVSALDCGNSHEEPLATSENGQVGSRGASVGATSGTSSPSLEVQQILHTQNGKDSEYTDEEEINSNHLRVELAEEDSNMGDLGEDEEAPEALQNLSHRSQKKEKLPDQPEGGVSIASFLTNAAKEAKASSESAISPLLDAFSGVTGLPSVSQLTCVQFEQDLKQGQPSKVKINTVQNTNRLKNVKSLSQMTCEELEAGIKKESTSETDQEGFPDTDLLSSLVEKTNENRRSLSRTERSIENSSTNSNIGIISNMQYEMLLAKNRDLEEQVRSISKNLISMENLLLDYKTHQNKVDTLAEQSQRMAKQVIEVHTKQSQLQHNLPSYITNSIKPIVNETLRQEIKTQLQPVITKQLEPIKLHLNNEVKLMVNSSKSRITEDLNKVLHSRTFVDSVSSSVSSAVNVAVQNACREAYNKVVMPGFNAMSQQVFNQLNETFSRGTKEYVHYLENESHNIKGLFVDNMNKASRSLDTISNSISAQSKVIIEATNKMSSQQDALSSAVCEKLKVVVREEVNRVLQDQQNSIDNRSHRAATPVQPSHSANPKIAQQQIQQLISTGQFNSAFKHALSASDLALVVFVCERVNPQQLFTQTPCPLTQDVLLSLVNQLSHDLATFTDLKIKYLEESVINLEPNHPVTREHMKKVLQGFQRKLNTYLQLNPNNKKVRMLLMAVNHLAA